jgi:hypothetical protein
MTKHCRIKLTDEHGNAFWLMDEKHWTGKHWSDSPNAAARFEHKESASKVLARVLFLNAHSEPGFNINIVEKDGK